MRPGRASDARRSKSCPADALSTESGGQAVRGLAGEYFDNPRLEGAPRLTRTDTRMDFRWTLNSPGRGIPFDWYSVRWTGTITAPASGVQRIGVEGNDGYRLYLDDQLVIDNWQQALVFDANRATSAWTPGSRHSIRLEYFETSGQRAREAGLGRGGRRSIGRATIDGGRRARAIRATSPSSSPAWRKASSAIARGSSLPGRQEELISASPRRASRPSS